jgi:hypothetical protein
LVRQYTGNFAALHEQEGNDDEGGKATHRTMESLAPVRGK